MRRMNGNDILTLGFVPGKSVGLALKAAREAAEMGQTEGDIVETLKKVVADPALYIDDPVYKQLAQQVSLDQDTKEDPKNRYHLDTYAPYKIWGRANIDPGAIAQLERAVRLPVSVKGALMPDAHQGYGLPIGGVLATHNAVIPYAVGVDIACRMRLTIFDASPIVLDQKRDKYRKILENNTCFGAGNAWETRRDHPVLVDPLWREHPIARKYRDVAWRQLGTSGSGNHFVEFGELEVQVQIETPLGAVPPGKYLALLSHSGSRRFGFEMANFYTEAAMNRHRALPKDFIHLAWLDLDTETGIEYWEAMHLAGKYASANHAIIHEQIIHATRFEVLGGVENHHNFSWKEVVDGQEMIVHRKGATPAGEGVLGVIPGSMLAPGYVVRGKGNPDSLSSAAHGAGRRMSRREAFNKFEWEYVKRKLKSEGVDLLSAGLDEAPGAYKDIKQVMTDQSDLVEILGAFQPRLVKMDGSDRKNYHPED